MFQFHKGTIKTEDKRAMQRCNLRFNSIKVRLRQLAILATPSSTFVSIP